ncbi:Small nuclear ribonucleoprotein LSM1 [Spraguea lophii 42_110]|uniref:Small nuclear ribonucleoprotein LSM1 n=1 Tax=Spraguea lophii (strain 42_110) TaxID=1358809 RepID=S7W4T2_SPRLO|nr:Small nuclear ribonucleoprotein LSM1 [Spraguea lophii 42_110]
MKKEIIGCNDYEEYLDCNVTILLYDGRYIFGILRSFDQFYNLSLEQTVERGFINNIYYEKHLGMYIIRGENVVLIGKTVVQISKYKKVNEEEFKIMSNIK